MFASPATKDVVRTAHPSRYMDFCGCAATGTAATPSPSATMIGTTYRTGMASASHSGAARVYRPRPGRGSPSERAKLGGARGAPGFGTRGTPSTMKATDLTRHAMDAETPPTLDPAVFARARAALE